MIMMRSLAFACLGLAAPGAPAQELPPPYTGPLRALVYTDTRIPDADRAQLVHLVSEVVQRQYWRPITAKKGLSIDKLVDCYYDAFVTDPATKLTAEALQAEIKLQSPLVVWPTQGDTPVMMPPFPAIANRIQDRRSVRFRGYDTLNDAYSIAERPSDFSPKAMKRVADQAIVSEDSTCEVRLEHRDAKYTAVIVPVDNGREEIIRSRVPRSVGQVSIGRDAELGRVRIQLLQEGLAACLENAGYLTQSPFWKDLKQLVGRLEPELVKAAAGLPLVILDQNFTEETGEGEGHGFKVHKVAAEVLRVLELPKLMDQIKNVDLCPATEQGIEELKQRVAKVPTNASSPLIDAILRKEADDWLKDRGQPCLGGEFDVPDLVLAAVLRRELESGSWLVMSFRARGSVENLLRGAFDSSSLSVVAAGNDDVMLDDAWTPQTQASKTQRVILVTHGGEKGVLGTYSSKFEGLKVDVTAPGCGVGENWTAGSSLAAPLVAVAAWLKELIGRASGTAAAGGPPVRSAVTAASRPSSSIGTRVLSAGMFDVSRYIVAPFRHIRFRDGVDGRAGPQVLALTNGQFSINCGGPQPVQGSGDANQTVLHTLVPSADGTSLVRRQLGIGWRLQEFGECGQVPLNGFLLTVTYPDGRTEQFDWQKFTRQVMEVSF